MNDTPYSGANTRRNIVAFLVGKVPTALLTMAILGLSARTLPAAEFGRYVLVMAAVEIVLGTSTLGLDWILLRYAPVYRLNGSRAGLARMIAAVAAARGVLLSLLVAALLAGGGALAAAGRSLPLPPDLYLPFGVLLVTEGVMRILRDNTLEALALQSRLQLVLVARNAIIALALLYFNHHGGAVARELVLTEAAAAACTLLLSLAAVATALRAMTTAEQVWTRPSARQMLRVAMLNYASGIVEYLYSPNFLILLLAGTESAAAIGGLGFALRLTDIIRNYLPGMLVFGLVRSRMIGAYVRSQDFGELRMWAQFLYKISLLTLLPVMGLVLVDGELILNIASGGRYAAYHSLFAVLCFWLALRLHRLILGVVFNAVELMHAWARAALLSLLVLPVIYLLGHDRLGIWFVAVALFGNELIVNGLALRALRRHRFDWRLGLGWMARAGAAMAAACALAWALPREGMVALAGAALLLGCAYTAGLLLFGVLDRQDRQLVNRSVGRTVFRHA